MGQLEMQARRDTGKLWNSAFQTAYNFTFA